MPLADLIKIGIQKKYIMNEDAHRGPLLHIRGWLEYPENSVEIVHEIIEGSIKRAKGFGFPESFIKEVNKAWTLPELQIPEEQRYLMWSYLFVGAYLNIKCEDIFRYQVEELSKIFEWNGPLKIWMSGEIQIEDDAGKWSKTWLIKDSCVKEKNYNDTRF